MWPGSGPGSVGGTQVDESRQYFNKDAVLIRELRKSGRFKPGESTDTQHVPNVVHQATAFPCAPEWTWARRQKSGALHNPLTRVPTNLCARPSAASVLTSGRRDNFPVFPIEAGKRGDSGSFSKPVALRYWSRSSSSLWRTKKPLGTADIYNALLAQG